LLTIYKEIQGLADPSPAALPHPAPQLGRNFPKQLPKRVFGVFPAHFT
jgi:hypothetical protein